MRAGLIILIVLGAWLAYQQHKKLLTMKSAVQPLVPAKNNNWNPSPGSTSTLYSGFGAVTQLSKSGNNSPGSGIASMQPKLKTTWGIGGTYGIGRIGVTYAQ